MLDETMDIVQDQAPGFAPIGVTILVLQGNPGGDPYNGIYIADSGYLAIEELDHYINQHLQVGDDRVILINMGLAHSEMFMNWIQDHYQGHYVPDANLFNTGYYSYHVIGINIEIQEQMEDLQIVDNDHDMVE